MAVAERLERVYRLAQATGHLSRFVVFGSFVTDKPEPHDVDVFLVMDDAFDAGTLPGETALAFDHAAGRRALWCQRVLGASSGRFRRRASRGRILASEAGGWPPGHCGDHRGDTMIRNDQELETMLDRIRHFQAQLAHLRKVETNPTNYRLSASGFLAEIDRMQLEVREYLSLPAVEAA